jgi:hypothetical protein
MRWVLVVVLLCGARIAHADPIGVIAYGEPSMQTDVAKRFEKWLRKHDHAVVDSPMSADAINTLANCLTIDDLACARSVFDARAKADTVIYVGIAAADKNVTFTVYLFAKGKDPVAERRICEKCKGTAWHELTNTILERLTAGVPVTRPAPSRLGPALVLGAGVAAMATGAVFLYYGAADGADRKYIYPDSTPVGIAVATVGVGAAIGGAIWLWQTGSAQSGPVASATREGAYVGWAGQF